MRQDALTCHPERSEGSHWKVQLELSHRLRFFGHPHRMPSV